MISLIINKTKSLHGNLDFFYDITNVPRNDSINFDRFYITKEVLRTEMGFTNDKKPGDFDIIIIPAYKEHIYFEYTSAFEIKIVRPTNKNPRRNSNSLGTSQIQGMIDDGFPLIGLIHICMNEPVARKYLKYLPNLDDFSEIVTFDPFPLYSIEAQYERILKTELPKYIGINVLALCFDQQENLILQDSSKFMAFKKGYFNPNTKQSTIDKIENHYNKFVDKYFVKVNS